MKITELPKNIIMYNVLACGKFHELKVAEGEGTELATLISLVQNIAGFVGPKTYEATVSYPCPLITDEGKQVFLTIVLPISKSYKNPVVQITGQDVTKPVDKTIYQATLANAQQNALFEFAKNAITNSIDVLKDFIKFMVPLTTGLITVYFALLEFLGIKTVTNVQILTTSLLIIPPILLLISLGLFIWVAFPIKSTIVGGNLDSIKHYRNKTFYRKYTPSIIGGFVFIVGILSMIIILVPLVTSDFSDSEKDKSTYNNHKYGYTIQFESFSSTQVLNDSKTVIFYLPGDSTGPTMKLEVEEFQQVPRIDRYVMKRISILGGGLSNFTVMDNNPAYVISWNNNSKGSGFEFLTIKNSKGYLIDYEANNKTNYDIYNPIVQQMIQSFKFIN